MIVIIMLVFKHVTLMYAKRSCFKEAVHNKSNNNETHRKMTVII